MNFLPQDYKSPTPSTSYTKLLDGENRLRILSRPVVGWEDWLDKKPVRFRFKEKPAHPFDPSKPAKHFWSMIVWNYRTEQIEILHLTQTSIRQSIEALCHDKDWGAPFHYDIKITRKGEGMDTEYVVNPIPHKAIHPMIQEKFEDKPCYLEALFDGLDPFNMELCGDKRTPGVFDEQKL